MVEWFWWDSSLISTTNWFPSVLWHCWFDHLACKNRPRNDLLCVEWDVKPYTLTHYNQTIMQCLTFRLISSECAGDVTPAVLTQSKMWNEMCSVASACVFARYLKNYLIDLFKFYSRHSLRAINFWCRLQHRWVSQLATIAASPLQSCRIYTVIMHATRPVDMPIWHLQPSVLNGERSVRAISPFYPSNLSGWVSESCFMSHSAHNRSFRTRAFPGVGADFSFFFLGQTLSSPLTFPLLPSPPLPYSPLLEK